MPLGGSIPPFGTKTSRLAEHKIIGIGSKILADESSGVVVTGVTLILPFDSWTCESWP